MFQRAAFVQGRLVQWAGTWERQTVKSADREHQPVQGAAQGFLRHYHAGLALVWSLARRLVEIDRVILLHRQSAAQV